MIMMFCDHCGEKISRSTSGAIRVKFGRNKELTFHLCSEDQGVFEGLVRDFCVESPPETVNPRN